MSVLLSLAWWYLLIAGTVSAGLLALTLVTMALDHRRGQHVFDGERAEIRRLPEVRR